MRKKISKGGFFGEIALIKNVPRTATVTVQKDVRVLYLEREDFFEIIKQNLLTGVNVDSIAMDRLTKIAEKAEEACL